MEGRTADTGIEGSSRSASHMALGCHATSKDMQEVGKYEGRDDVMSSSLLGWAATWSPLSFKSEVVNTARGRSDLERSTVQWEGERAGICENGRHPLYPRQMLRVIQHRAQR